MRYSGLICLALFALLPSLALGVDYRVEELAEPAPSDAVSADVAATLAPAGLRVFRGETRVICDIWLCQAWPVADFKAKGDVIYPLTPGQLIGVVRYARKASDFRDQDIADGVYTLRYSQQPVDGAHVGTSPTRDFLLLLPAAEDTKPAPIEYKPLTKLSAQAAGTTHPCLLSLQRVAGEDPVRHNEDRDWWLVRLKGKLTKGDESQPLELDLVVEGVAE